MATQNNAGTDPALTVPAEPVCVALSALCYGNWTIEFCPPPVPSHAFDYEFVHVDYDGDEDSRHGHAESVIDAMTQINDIEDGLFQCSCTAAVPGECMATSACAFRTDNQTRFDAYETERARYAVQVQA